MTIRSLETMHDPKLRAAKIKGMQADAAYRLNRNTMKRGGKRFTFPHGARAAESGVK